MVNEVADRCDVYGGMKTRYGGAPGHLTYEYTVPPQSILQPPTRNRIAVYLIADHKMCICLGGVLVRTSLNTLLAEMRRI